jgi:hypothetical protein
MKKLNMKAEQALELLIKFNLLRRGDDDAIEQASPKEISEAIDIACEFIKQGIESQPDIDRGSSTIYVILPNLTHP